MSIEALIVINVALTVFNYVFFIFSKDISKTELINIILTFIVFSLNAVLVILPAAGQGDYIDSESYALPDLSRLPVVFVAFAFTITNLVMLFRVRPRQTNALSK